MLFTPHRIVLFWILSGILWFTIIFSLAKLYVSGANSPVETPMVSSEAAKTLETSTVEDCRIIVLGDSLTAGYELDISQAYPAQLEKTLRSNGYLCTVVNGGVSGDTSKALLDRLDFTLGNDRYNLALLIIGGNDGLQTLPVEDLRKNIVGIVTKLKEKKIPVVLAGMQIPNNAGTYAQTFKKIYPEIATAQGLPYYPFFLEWVAMNPKYSLSDGIHPNAIGYGIITKNIYEFLKKEKLLEKLPKNAAISK